jgi:hypothetical protein
VRSTKRRRVELHDDRACRGAVVVIRRPLVVDETADNDEVTADDVREAEENYLNMSRQLRAYVDALARRFDGAPETRVLN